MKYFGGIDPGFSGAVVVIDSDRKIIQKSVAPIIKNTKGKDWYDVNGMNIIIKIIPDDTMVYLEQAQAMPKQGAVSMFRYGVGFGIWYGMLTAHGKSFLTVRPAAWHKVIMEGLPHLEDPKATAQIAVNQLFPGVDLRASDRCKKPHSGLVDALLIAEYGYRHYGSFNKGTEE